MLSYWVWQAYFLPINCTTCIKNISKKSSNCFPLSCDNLTFCWAIWPSCGTIISGVITSLILERNCLLYLQDTKTVTAISPPKLLSTPTTVAMPCAAGSNRTCTAWNDGWECRRCQCLQLCAPKRGPSHPEAKAKLWINVHSSSKMTSCRPPWIMKTANSEVFLLFPHTTWGRHPYTPNISLAVTGWVPTTSIQLCTTCLEIP
jgi:hypothetical protein